LAQKPLRTKANDGRITSEQLRAERERLLLVRASSRASKRDSLLRVSREARRFGRNRRRARAFGIAIVAAFAALFGIVLASLFTPLLAIQKIEISGLHRISKDAVLAALTPQVGVPLTMVNAEKIAAELDHFKLIESFSTVAAPPHTLQVRIIERLPVCIVTIGGINDLYDVAGVELGQASARDQYPVVSISGSPRNSKNYADAIQVLLSLPVSLVKKVAVVEARSQDNVVIQLKGLAGQQIVWGDSSRSALKATVLASLLKHVRASQVATIDVSAPTAPVVRYGN
jgi:cell division protein FtsQ